METNTYYWQWTGSKWVEAIPVITCDAKIMLKFLHRHIFSGFVTPRAIVSDEGTVDP